VFSLNEFGGLRRIKSNDLDSGLRQNDGFDKHGRAQSLLRRMLMQ
jgi:hypothetical protein